MPSGDRRSPSGRRDQQAGRLPHHAGRAEDVAGEAADPADGQGDDARRPPRPAPPTPTTASPPPRGQASGAPSDDRHHHRPAVAAGRRWPVRPARAYGTVRVSRAMAEPGRAPQRGQKPRRRRQRRQRRPTAAAGRHGRPRRRRRPAAGSAITSSRRGPVERREQAVGGVDQAVEVQHAGEGEVGGDHDGGGDRARATAGRPPTRSPPSASPRAAPTAGNQATAAGDGAAAPPRGVRKARASPHQAASSRQASRPGHDQQRLVGDGRHGLVDQPRASRNRRPTSVDGWTPRPTSSRHDDGVAVPVARARAHRPAASTAKPRRPADPGRRGVDEHAFRCTRRSAPAGRLASTVGPRRRAPGPVGGDASGHVGVVDVGHAGGHVGRPARRRPSRSATADFPDRAPPSTSVTVTSAQRRRRHRAPCTARASRAPQIDRGPPKACGGPSSGQAMQTASVAVPVPAMPELPQRLRLGLGGGGDGVDEGGVGQPLGQRHQVDGADQAHRAEVTSGAAAHVGWPSPTVADTSTPSSVADDTRPHVGGGEHAHAPARAARARRRACRGGGRGRAARSDGGTWAFTTQRRGPSPPPWGDEAIMRSGARRRHTSTG